jgi:hypothetical protein
MSEMCFDDFDYDRHSDNCECTECTAKNTICTQPTDVQQLKAEIAAALYEYNDISSGAPSSALDILISKLRQLSAV